MAAGGEEMGKTNARPPPMVTKYMAATGEKPAVAPNWNAMGSMMATAAVLLINSVKVMAVTKRTRIISKTWAPNVPIKILAPHMSTLVMDNADANEMAPP